MVPQIGSWNGHTFEVSENLIRGFTEMSIKGGCEVTEKNTKQQKYVERKYGEIPSISLVVGLNAMVGVTDVMEESMAFISEATEGAMDYFYLGSKKLIPGKMRLTEAEVVEICHMPGKGDVWISSKVKLTLKQGTESDGGGGGGGNSESKKPSVKTPKPANNTNLIGSLITGLWDLTTMGINTAKTLIEKARTSSAQAKNNTVDLVTSAAPYANRVTQTNQDSSKKTSPTTGRGSFTTERKITRNIQR